MKNKITKVIDASFEVISSKASSISSAVGDAGYSALEAGKNAGQSVGKVAATTAVLIGDLNGDGKLDIEDAKIATDKAKQMVAEVAEESVELGKEVMRSELVKDVAAHAAVGALIAVPVPFVGPAFGAIAGAALGLYKTTDTKK